MAKRSDNDLFSSSTMTFGEHLEELRICLTKSVAALLLFSVVGFFVSKYVVRFIERPVISALQRHMVAAAKDELYVKYGDAVKEDMYEMLDERVLIVEEVYIEREQLERWNVAGKSANTANATAENAAKQPTAPVFDTVLPLPTMNFVKTRIWREAQAKIQALDPWETFMIYLKASLVVGAVLASPYIFYQVWLFVAAGLYHHERRYVYIYMPLSLLLFLAGVSLAFAFVFQPVLDFLFGYNREMNISPEMRISSIINFVLLLPLGFGVSFQLPLVMFFLNRLGLIPYEIFLKKWKIAVLLIFVAAMVLTPSPDPTSMLLMAIPLLALYLLGLAMIKWMPGGRNPFGEEHTK
jgi:sec-independent protein translocase protein TatC